MPDGQSRTETKSVQAFRVLEARTITKWEQEGWHLVTQTPGKLRTELTFERERPSVPKKALIAGAAVFVVAALAITIGALTEQDEPTAAAPAPTTAAPAPSTSAPPLPAPTATEPQEPAASESSEAETLTVKNNKDLAALVKLDANCDDSVEKFADTYKDRTIKFDGAVAAINLHGSYKTRYDILLVPGEANDDVQYGPTFQYTDVNLINDLGWTGPNIPDSLGVKTKLRFTATVGEYDTDTCLFQLDPVETSAR